MKIIEQSEMALKYQDPQRDKERESIHKTQTFKVQSQYQSG